jgi:regulator of replication initiation timing
MALINLSQAARMANVSRPHLYKRYIQTGKMTVDRSDPKGPLVDTSEILRLFGKLNEDAVNTVNSGKHLHEATPVFTLENNPLQPEVAALRERLQDAQDHLQAAKDRERVHQERERWLQGQVDKLTDAVKLLEHRPTVIPAEDPAVQAEYAVLLEAERTRAVALEFKLEAERSKGFWSRLFHK